MVQLDNIADTIDEGCCFVSGGTTNEKGFDPDDDDFFRMIAEMFKILSDPTRVRILQCLFSGELCVCNIARLLKTSQSAVSHQLRILRANRLVKYRRHGKMVFYSLDDHHVELLLDQASDHVREEIHRKM